MLNIRIGIVTFACVFAVGLTAPATGSPGRGGEGGCRANAFQPVGSARRSWVVFARDAVVARRSPGGRVIARFGRVNVNEYPTLFSVRGRLVDARCRTRWWQVQLPLRPNGRTGWVPAAPVGVASVVTRLEVDLSARELRLFRAGRLRLRAPAAVGSVRTPTPVGRFYVNQRLVPYDLRGPYGPGALGVSAFSDVLTGWAQGGPIAIHGTNQPGSIGRAVSKGCVRVRNETLRRLIRETPAGTPVIIHP
ncbi:MAG: L,D-transpeptidase [Gaiellaceae bacterium]